MDYLNIGLDGPVSIFDICQAYQQLESDYNRGGWLRERPSNQRRMESISCQLSRMKYSDSRRWVDICAEPDGQEDPGDEDVKDIYLHNVLKWGLPIDAEMMTCIKKRYVPWFTDKYPQCQFTEYLQH